MGGAGGAQARLLALGQGGVVQVDVWGGNSPPTQATASSREGTGLGLGLGPDTVNGPMER